MSKEVVVSRGQELEQVQPQPQENILGVIARAAADPNVDVAKMQALLDLQERFTKQQAEVAFKASLSEIQAISPRVLKDGKIIVKGTLRSTYATFEAVDEALRPLTKEHGFSYRFTTEAVDAKNMLVVMTVSHKMGHSERAQMPLPVDVNEYRSAVQNVRSSISFAKRCLISDFFNIVTVGEDDDGAGRYISLDQVNQMRDLIIHYNIDEKAFLRFVEASSIEKIPERKYDMALAALKRKVQR